MRPTADLQLVNPEVCIIQYAFKVLAECIGCPVIYTVC